MEFNVKVEMADGGYIVTLNNERRKIFTNTLGVVEFIRKNLSKKMGDRFYA